jgi:hypothetical protein
VTRAPGTQALLSSRTLGAAVYFPLLVAATTVGDGLLPLHDDERAYELNMLPEWRDRLGILYGGAFTPENVLGYIYALLSSTTYREDFEGALEDDFPRIPLTTDETTFELLATEGLALVRLHLLEDLSVSLPRINGAGDLTIGEARYDETTNELWINATQRVGPVSPSAWETRIGNYQVLELWLRNRAGRRLARDEATELTRIVGSLAAAALRRPDIEALVEDLLEGEIVTA